jgi:hypothetical protein
VAPVSVDDKELLRHGIKCMVLLHHTAIECSQLSARFQDLRIAIKFILYLKMEIH